MPWISRGEMRRLLRQLSRAEHRAESAQQSLDIERHDNRAAERHWSNMMLRARQIGAYPLPELASKSPLVPADLDAGPQPTDLDLGELEAVVAAGALSGVTPRDAENFLRREKGLPLI